MMVGTELTGALECYLNTAVDQLKTTAQNMANMTTTGFKAQTTNFATLFYQQLGANGADDPLEVGSGVGVAATETNFGAGAITTDSTPTDMALNGNGFFVVNDGGTTELTRAGDFSVTNAGALVTENGASVMGYPATNGVVNTNANLTAISLPIGQTQQAQATSQISLTANLNATSGVGAVVAAPIQIYDSLGAPHTVTATMTKTAQNTWSYSIALPPGDASSGSTPSNTTGSLTFDANGNLASMTPNLASPGATIPLGAAGAALTPPSPTSIANAATPGYTEEAAIWQQADPIQVGLKSVGDGVLDTGAASQRDPVLNKSIDVQTQGEAASAARLSALDTLEATFSSATSVSTASGVSAADGSISNSLSSFFGSLEDLEASPADVSIRQSVLASASTLANSFNASASSLQQQQQSLNGQVSSIVTQANGLLTSLAGLNAQIESQDPNKDAGALEDQRQQDLTSLSQLIGGAADHDRKKWHRTFNCQRHAAA